MNVRAFRGRRCDFKHLIEVIVVWPTVCCAMLLAGCGAIPNSEASDGPPESLVMRVDSRQQPTPTEAAVLAHRILQRESGELLVDEGRRRALAREIEPVLSRIRDAHPAMADITVRQTHAFGELVVTLEPDMSEALSGLLDDATTGSVTLHTGHEEFDALNARLGLSAVELFSSLNSGVFYFNEHLNVYAASRAYSMMGGIELAEPNMYLEDGSDIEASKSQGIWHVVIRHAWGDCPSGCIFEELFFFTVKGAGVERLERLQAMNMVEFSALVEGRRWRWSTDVDWVPPG